jgi:hypothetical protein
MCAYNPKENSHQNAVALLSSHRSVNRSDFCRFGVSIVLAALTTASACNRTTRDACASPDPDVVMSDPDGGDASATDPPPVSCQTCAELASGVVDQRFAAIFAADLIPLVEAVRPGGTPLINPGALNGAPTGTLLRYASISGAILTQQALMDLLEARIGTALRRSADPSHRGDEQQQQDDIATVGDACAALLTINSADRSVSSRAPGLITDISAYLAYAEPLQAALFNESFAPIEKVVNHARLFSTCGRFTADSNAIFIGTQWAQLAVSRQAPDGSYLDDQGVFDTARQSYVILALIDASRAISQGDCSNVISSVQRADRWLAARVTATGQIDSSGSRFTCQSGASSVLSTSAVFRALAMGEALTSRAPIAVDDADIEAGAAEPVGSCGQAALRVSQYVRNNPGAPSCFP